MSTFDTGSTGSFDKSILLEKRHARKVINEAHERIKQLEEAASQRFWNEQPDITYQLKSIPTLRDLNVPIFIPKTVYLTRLLLPISDSSATPQKQLQALLSEIDSLKKPLSPTDSKTARIIQNMRALLIHQKTRDSLINLLVAQEEAIYESEIAYHEVDWEEKDFSIRSLIIRCLKYPNEIPAKEEVLYFIATLAMNFPDASSETVDTFFTSVADAFQESLRGVDEHILARHKAKEQHEFTLMTARFQVHKVARYLPPVFCYSRYKHKGKVAGHRLRTLCLFTTAIMMHYWRRPILVRHLIVECCECQQISRLHLLNLLQIVMDNWPTSEGRILVNAVNDEMNHLLKCRDDGLDTGQKKSANIILECCKRFRHIKKVCGATALLNSGTTFDKKKIMNLHVLR